MVTTEVGKAAAIFAVLALHLVGSLVLLPLLGMMLNGTSSVLYGSVPELVSAKRIERAFALFYTSILGPSALAPVLYGPAWTEMPRGGHFAAAEEPELLAADLRAFFRNLRT